MCGRFTLATDLEALAGAFPGVSMPEVLAPRYNIAPTQPVAVICNQEPLRVEFLHWGLIPHWAKDQTIGSRMINARAESLSEKPSFREPFKKKRCLILADGFYEWKKDSAGKIKIPMYIRLKSGKPFAFAGLWDVCHLSSEEIRSCTIITTVSNELVSEIHDRMPVIISPAKYSDWLDPKERKPESMQELLGPYPADEMAYYQVSSKVNDPKVDDPEFLKPVF